jgi:hypothetical protein
MRIRRGLPALVVLGLLACDAGSSAPTPASASAGASSAAPRPTAAQSSAAPTPTPAPLAPAPPLSPRRAALLAKDVADRVDLLRQLTPPITRYKVVADTFVVAAGDPSAPLDAAAALIQRTVDALYAGPFAHRPDQGVSVFVYGDAHAYETAFSASSLGIDAKKDLGVYDDRQRNVFVRTDAAGVGSLAHEIGHPLILADFPNAPLWLLEGGPALLEVADFSRPGQIHAKAHFRLQTLRDTLDSKDKALAASIRLDTLFGMSSEAFRDGPEYLHYACAREALRWLDSMGKLWAWYSAYREGWLTDHDGVAAFTKVMGKSPAEATPDWLAWIQSPASEKDAP